MENQPFQPTQKLRELRRKVSPLNLALILITVLSLGFGIVCLVQKSHVANLTIKGANAIEEAAKGDTYSLYMTTLQNYCASYIPSSNQIDVYWGSCRKEPTDYADRGDYSSFTLTTLDTSHLVETYSAFFGEGGSEYVFLFLMDDGTVRYIALDELLERNDVVEPQTIAGVSNVAKIVTTLVSTEGYSGTNFTAVAQKTDGTFYDLYYPLVEAEAIKSRLEKNAIVQSTVVEETAE